MLQIVSYLVRKLTYCLFAFKRKTLIWCKNNCEVNLCSFDLKKKKVSEQRGGASETGNVEFGYVSLAAFLFGGNKSLSALSL